MPVTIRNPYAVPGEYHKAQLHCHTAESDGRLHPRELLQLYKDAGYAFVFITDHNRITRCDELNDATFLTLPGTEDTMPRLVPPLGPHLGRLFVERPLHAGTAQQRIDQTVAAGGIASLCHPSWTGNLWTGRWQERAATTLRGYRLVEIWNPHSDSQKDVHLWDAALRTRGAHDPVWGVAVDDAHRRQQVDHGWIMVKVAAMTEPAVRTALQTGAFYASTGLSVEFRVESGHIVATAPTVVAVRFVDRDGRIRLDRRAGEVAYRVQGDEGYVRVECAAAGGRAWSQPFWIVPG